MILGNLVEFATFQRVLVRNLPLLQFSEAVGDASNLLELARTLLELFGCVECIWQYLITQFIGFLSSGHLTSQIRCTDCNQDSCGVVAMWIRESIASIGRLDFARTSSNFARTFSWTR